MTKKTVNGVYEVTLIYKNSKQVLCLDEQELRNTLKEKR